MKRTLATLLVLAVALPSPALWAGEATDLEVGERVRFVRVGEKQKLEGTLLARNLEALTLKVEGQREQISVPLESVHRLEVQRGSKYYTGKGALIGVAAGAAFGFAVLATDDSDFFSQNELLIPGILGLLGGGLGALVGGAIRTDRWQEVDPDGLRVAVGPTRGGGVGAQVSFGF